MAASSSHVVFVTQLRQMLEALNTPGLALAQALPLRREIERLLELIALESPMAVNAPTARPYGYSAPFTPDLNCPETCCLPVSETPFWSCRAH